MNSPGWIRADVREVLFPEPEIVLIFHNPGYLILDLAWFNYHPSFLLSMHEYLLPLRSVSRGHLNLAPKVVHSKDIRIGEEIDVGKIVDSMADTDPLECGMGAPCVSIFIFITYVHFFGRHSRQVILFIRFEGPCTCIEASAELLKLVNNITKMDKESFVGAFEERYEKYKDIVNERVQDKRIKHKTPPYMRPRLRSAYLSVRRNKPLLWTFYDHPETGLLNTNNALEGLFSDLKSKVRVHSGISKEHRQKLLDEYIKRHY